MSSKAKNSPDVRTPADPACCIAAVKAALNQTAASLIDSEMRSCVSTCWAAPMTRLERVTKALAAVVSELRRWLLGASVVLAVIGFVHVYRRATPAPSPSAATTSSKGT